MEKKIHRKNGIVVTLDGPAGAGKSTVAKTLAKKLDYSYVDTGAIYRCVALLARERGILSQEFKQASPEDQKIKQGVLDTQLRKIIDELLDQNAIRFAWLKDEHQTFIGERNVSKDIRVEANSQAASSISARPLVRSGLLEFQRKLGQEGAVVLEGRDTGTVVFPDAEVKVFLSATPQERANRRFLDLKQKGFDPDFQEVLQAIVERDKQDTERAHAPLQAAADAHDLDSTALSVEEVVERLLRLIRDKQT